MGIVRRESRAAGRAGTSGPWAQFPVNFGVGTTGATVTEPQPAAKLAA